jgi:coenzyme F420-reducing hydrogenase gamma subunit
MKIGIFQFAGCNKCFNETILLKDVAEYDIQRIEDPKNWNGDAIDIAVITGYLTADDKSIVEKIQSNSKRILAYGTCTTTGGIFGLAYQHGIAIKPLAKLISESEIPVENIHGCLGEIEELKEKIESQAFSKSKSLCSICSRKSTCAYLDEIQRQVDVQEDEEACFNDFGYMCMGYIATECKENCVKSGAPCRGCKPKVDRPGIRMLGMFGTLMGNVEVATEATGKGGTDKLADEDDDMTEAMQDVTGNFFRFSLANSVLPIGKIPSTGSIYSDIFTGRLIEEIPMIMGQLGGENAISLTLDILTAYETGANLSVSDKSKELREKLLALEGELQKAIKSQDNSQFADVSAKIKQISGNMNLSNLFFGGFRTPVEAEEDFDSYKSEVFEIEAGDYQSGKVKYSIDEQGKIIKFKMEA